MTMNASAAIAAFQAGSLSSAVTISDSGANIASNLDALQTLANANKITGITLTDLVPPVISITLAQLIADYAVLADIQSNYTLSYAGQSIFGGLSTAASVISAYNSGSKPLIALIVDTAANVASKIDTLQSIINSGELLMIYLVDSGTPTLSITAAQNTADSSVIRAILNTPINVSVATPTTTPVTVAVAISEYLTVTTQINISDTSTNIVNNFSTLTPVATAGKLGQITVTDNNFSTFTLTGSQYSAGTKVLANITNNYTINLTNVAASLAPTIINDSHVTSIIINDSASNIASNITSIQTLESTNKVTSISVSDTALSVTSNLNTLQTLAAASPPVTITLTDTGTPVMAVTDIQLSADAKALADITNHFSLNAGVSVTVSNFIVQQDIARDGGGSSFNVDVPLVGAQSGYNVVIGFQSATLPTGGKNVLLLDGTQSQYTFSVDATGALVMTDHSGGTTNGQTINVTGASYLVFNGTGALTTNQYNSMMIVATGGDATIAKLYQSSLGRMPDLPGLEAWQHQLDAGLLSMSQITQDFLTSGEFTKNFGAQAAMSDATFINAMYHNILGRAPDATGATAWTSYLTGLEGSGGNTAAANLAARAVIAQNFATSAEETINAASWLIDPSTGGYATAGQLLAASTVVNQAVGNHYLNAALADPTTMASAVTTSAFQLSPSSGAGATLTVVNAAPAETVLLSTNIPSLVVQNSGDSVVAGSGSETVTISGGANTSVAVGSGTLAINVLGGTNTTIPNFSTTGASTINVANTTSAANLQILNGTTTAVQGASLSFGTTNYIVNIGNIGTGTAASVAAAANLAYVVGDVNGSGTTAGEHITFMGQDSQGNTQFWFWGSTAGAANGMIPLSSLLHTADVNGTHQVDASTLVQIATLTGVLPSALSAANLA